MPPSDPVEVTIVIPAYNEQGRIGPTVVHTLDHLERHHPNSELLVVDDGSSDATASIVEQVGQGRARVLRQPRNMGKGAAVRRGMLEARGDYVLFMDADMSTPVEELEKFLAIAKGGVDVVIGSRGLADSDIRQRQPTLRELMGRGFNVIVRGLLFGGIRDTQCGFKMFSRRAAREIFSRTTLDGFAFDVEALMLAQKLGFTLREVPVIWYHAPHSKVSPFTDATRMFADIVALRLKHRG
ncbi:MAG: glycosyltransferase family 2 protein [Deltaproteobacteria bacterium]|nr:glycosyltransferase family 2 protein [Deltaproteobacteria bacterium]